MAETPLARPRGNGAAAEEPGTSSERDGPRPLSEALLADLTAQRTAALQACFAGKPDAALLALTQAMVAPGGRAPLLAEPGPS